MILAFYDRTDNGTGLFFLAFDFLVSIIAFFMVDFQDYSSFLSEIGRVHVLRSKGVKISAVAGVCTY